MHERQRERHVLTRAATDVDVCFSLRESDGRVAETPTAEIGPWDGTKGQDGATGRQRLSSLFELSMSKVDAPDQTKEKF
ncbi:hypothetical protein OPV22_034167 [Ensete ventricosum]|uniref:RIN4 pathogenic type III effector avirulence factor Avr cleavage site domain-containing protein n=1 Tax=Ensete ventricosum TaxID=4639 RepID=A0AAV8P411_ENSVE|nr:hypothetical protein OPV22_034167 [Ensete ventricosum]